jgi:dTDP-4-dehydrorhamnose reductase
VKVMITGAKGQLGNDCAHIFGKTNQIIAVDLEELDITRAAEVDTFVAKTQPDLIINCAAHTGVDACETEKESAWAANVSGPRNLAESVNRWGGHLVHISTDYVFDGRKPTSECYVEEDGPNPLSYYGKTKLEGENAVRNATERHTILRTAWLYGAKGHNFLKTMLKLARANPDGELKVVNDQFGSPTWSYRLALQIEKLVEKGARGIYHATAEGVCTWYELADCFLNKMEVPHRLVSCTSDEFPTAAVRPINSILENRRLKEAGINVMAPWQDDVAYFVEKFGKQLLRETAV